MSIYVRRGVETTYTTVVISGEMAPELEDRLSKYFTSRGYITEDAGQRMKSAA